MIQEIYRGWRMQLFDRDAARALPGDNNLKRFLERGYLWHLRMISGNGRILSYESNHKDHIVSKGRSAINRIEDSKLPDTQTNV